MKRYPFSTMFCGRHLRIWKVIRSLLPLRKPVSAVSISRSPLNNGWDSQNCEFVIYVFKEEEDAAFIVNNGAVCPVGGKVDYKYESVE